ncbi:MAG: methyltransferase domain-containing protein [Bacteroidales bacterium]|nr:methyltransferase domain-containing protein [Bacteroidales bacterium]
MRQFIKFLVRHVPRIYLIRFSFAFSKIFALFYRGNKQYCPICEGHFRKFLPYGYTDTNSENRLCPSCLSLERHRQIWKYLENETNIFTQPTKLLHIAPEQSFYQKFKKIKTLDYYTGDLESPLAKYHFDIHQIPFDDNSFDVVMCNHVLEHVSDEFKASSEIYRVLKPGGWAILQVPINPTFETTYEDASITNPKEREKHFGQYDHVRWHGLDYPKRLEKSGFKVESLDYTNTFSATEIERMRLPIGELLYIARKTS